MPTRQYDEERRGAMTFYLRGIALRSEVGRKPKMCKDNFRGGWSEKHD
jgi:hypothetical protein